MKKFLKSLPLPIIFVVGGLFLVSSVYAATLLLSKNVDDNLEMRWTFDEGSGTTVNDATSNAHNATTMNSPSWVSGHIAGALSFNGVNQFVKSNDGIASLGQTNQPYTISAWVNVDSGVTDGNIIHESQLSVGTGWCLPPITLRGGKFSATSYGSAGGYIVTASTTMQTGQWYLVTTTWDAEGGLRLYINGNLATSTAQGDYVASGSANYIFAGGLGTNCVGDTGSYFKGSIDDVRVYSRALSPVDVRTLYGANTALIRTVSGDGLVSHYTFDRKDFIDAGVRDTGTNNFAGELSGGVSLVPGKLGQALHFDGSEYMETDRAVADDFTICAWFRTTAVGAGTDHWVSMPIYDVEQPGLANDFGFGVDANGHLMFGDGDLGDANRDFTVNSDIAVNTGQWVHGCVTRTEAGGAMTLYINGTQNTSESGSIESLSSHARARIGHGFDEGDGAGTYWLGDIDDVRIYNRVLSGTEINQLYQARSATLNASEDLQIADGLVGLWSFDGPDMEWTDATTGTSTDETNHNNDGTLVNISRTASLVPGKVGQAMYFSGDNQYVYKDTPNNFNVGATSRSIAGWVKMQVAPSTASYVPFAYGQCGMGNDGKAFGVYIDSDTNLHFWGCATADFNTGQTVSAGVWHHIAVTYNGSTVAVYVDGVVVGYADRTLVSGSGSWVVGSAAHIDPADFFFNGTIDEVRVYNRTLLPAEIRALYEMGK